MPQPTIADRYGFAALMPEIPVTFAAPIIEARENATQYLAPLAARRETIATDPGRSEIGKDTELRRELTTALKNARVALDRAKQQVTRARNDANGALGERVLRPGDDAEAIARVQATLRAVVVGGALAIPDLAAGHAHVVLGSTPFTKLLATTLKSAPRPQAASVVLGLMRLDPLSLMLLGGEAVVDAAKSVLEIRVAGEDESVATILQLRDYGDSALNVVRGDYSTVDKAALRALGLPREALPKPDPILLPPRLAS